MFEINAELVTLGVTVVAMLAAVIAAVIGVKFITKTLKSLWFESKPNEWLLVIRGGRLIQSGIGLKTFTWFTDSVVKFPSLVERVSFTASNVTKEVQGVDITGFAFWSVNRQGEGPFKCYKYMQSGNANANIKAVC